MTGLSELRDILGLADTPLQLLFWLWLYFVVKEVRKDVDAIRSEMRTNGFAKKDLVVEQHREVVRRVEILESHMLGGTDG